VKPLVSVIIPTFNREHTILRSVRSVLRQTYSNLELIIVDDGSDDQTELLIKSLNDTRIRYIKHAMNRWGGVARNIGCEMARADFIAFLDSDDQWLPDKLEKQVDFLTQLDRSFGLVYSDFYVIKKDHVKKRERYAFEDISDFLLTRNFIGTISTVIVKKAYFDLIGGFDENLESCQDWDLYLRLCKICKFGFLVDPLVKYFMNEENDRISNRGKPMISGHEKILKKYEADIAELPLDFKAELYSYIGCIYISVGHRIAGTRKLLQAFLCSGKIRYIFVLGKTIFVESLLPKVFGISKS
jgi:glycosyltransferase involved in cell wall biosynthesis